MVVLAECYGTDVKMAGEGRPKVDVDNALGVVEDQRRGSRRRMEGKGGELPSS